MTNFIVSGFPRSGTSMMMDCLKVGGMEIMSSPKRDGLNKKVSDDSYKMNPDSLHELSMQDIRNPWLLRENVGKVIKIPSVFLPMVRIPFGTEYSVVYMWRDSEEIRQSAQAIGMKMELSKIESIQRCAEAEFRSRGGQVIGLEYIQERQ